MSGAVVDVEDYWDAAGGGSRLGPGDEGGEICCNLKVLSGQSYYRWRRDYEGLKTSRGKWMKDLEGENSRANRFFYDRFQVTPAETEERFVYSKGDHAWNIPTFFLWQGNGFLDKLIQAQ